jgi:hypothetical protein
MKAPSNRGRREPSLGAELSREAVLASSTVKGEAAARQLLLGLTQGMQSPAHVPSKRGGPAWPMQPSRHMVPFAARHAALLQAHCDTAVD